MGLAERSVRARVGGTPRRRMVRVSAMPSRSEAAAPGWVLSSSRARAVSWRVMRGHAEGPRRAELNAAGKTTFAQHLEADQSSGPGVDVVPDRNQWSREQRREWAAQAREQGFESVLH
jgi:hypothetical protein